MPDGANLWIEGRRLFGPPNIDWCEAPLRALVEEPANTWSNLAYLAAAAFIYLRADRRPHLRRLSLTVFVMGMFSLLYHASNNALSQVLDFVGMYLYVGLLLTFNARRLGLVSERQARFHFLSTVAVNMLLLFLLRGAGWPIQLIIGANTLVIVGSELLLYNKSKQKTAERPRYGCFGVALLLMLAAGICSSLDLNRVWCDPHDHLLQGHAAWHVLSAASIPFVARFFEQFDL